eukprot:8603105-Ditylum_brightwellii.AAC.1
MNTHGANVYPSILSKRTASELRTFILTKNAQLKNEESISVIANDNRWSFGLSPDQHPIVSQALAEVYSHPTFSSSIQQIAGYDPAMVELTAITAAYGAADQHYHPDVMVSSSSRGYATSFAPTYSLFVQLQTTSYLMGPTHFCPGTHLCANEDDLEFCTSSCLRSATKEHPLEVGTGVLLNQQILHRGSAHLDPKDGSTRVMFILTFAPRPVYELHHHESRMIGLGGSYSTRFDMWGHTFNDMQYPERNMVFPWNVLKSFGLYKTNGSNWGWDYWTVTCLRIANADTDFTEHDLMRFQAMGGIYSFLPTWMQDFYNKVQTAFFRNEKEKEEQDYSVVSSHHTDWETYIGDTIDDIALFMTNVYIASVALYILILMVCSMLTYLVCKLHAWLSSSLSLSSSTNKFATRSIKRLFLLHLLVASCIYYMAVIHVDNTAWAKSIQNEKLFTPLLTSTTTVTIKKEKTTTEIVHPYNHLFQLTTYSPSTVPTKHDVLIGTRLHSQYLASNQYVLQYHPANIQFQKVLWSHAATYMQHRAIDAFPLRYHDMFQIIRNIISSNNKNDAVDGDITNQMNDIDDANNTERRKVGRVLYQHVHDGQWSTLTIPQTINIIQYE